MKEDVKTNISEEEIVLAPPTELFDEAKDIAQNTTAEEKFPFALQYDANQKEFLLSLLQTAGAIVENDDEEGHVLATMMNMTQLAFIKRLDCVERVRTDEGRNPFLAEEAVSPEAVEAETPVETPVETVAQQNVETAQTEQVMTLAADESVAVAAEPLAAIADDSNAANDGIAVANVYNTSSSCCCPTNKDMASAKEIQIETTVYGNICCPGAEQWFKFTVPKDATYTIYTTESLDTVGTLYDCCGNQIVEVDDYAPCGKINFRIIRYLTANTTYYLRVTEAKSDTGKYKLRVTQTRLVDSVSINMSEITLNHIGKVYELPVLPNTFAGVEGAEPLTNLKATTIPSSADEKKVIWGSFDHNVIKIDSGWYNGQRYQTLTVVGNGTAKLYAYDWNENGRRGECTINVNYCGGINYRDVTQHTMVLQSDGYYVCSKCGYRIKSPALQDKYILSEEDYYKVVSCLTAISYYAKIDGEDKGNYSIKATALRLLIDDIRCKSQYAQRYEYVGNDGVYKREYTVGNENDNYYMPVTINYNVIDNGLELMFNNGVASGIIQLIAGYAIPAQFQSEFQVLFFDMFDEYANLTDFLCGLAEKVGYKEISLI